MTAVARKTAELESKIASIGAELKFWCDESEAGCPWEKHHSQIRRVALTIETAAGKVAEELKKSVDENTVLDNARRLEQLTIDLHSLWEFYRGKLLMRATDPFRRHLVMADELAWACYEPALDRIDSLRKEPPLTFFNTATSPYMLPRDQSYRAFVDASRLRNEDALKLLKALPIPVIGIPWFQSSHLPDVLIVAHEVGHHVEELGLTTDLETAIAGANVAAGHAEAWKKWGGEVFADVYATLALGPGFTTALADFLATGRASIETEARRAPHWGDYPTAWMRMLISVFVLRRTFKAEADDIETKWRTAFGDHAMTAWEGDCAEIATAIVDHGYLGGELGLSDLACFTEIQQEHAVTAKENALRGAAIGSIDVRALVAGAALAFAEKPERFDKPVAGKSPQTRIAEQIVASRTAGTRAGAGRGDRGPTVVGNTKDRDAALGENLFQIIDQ